MKKGASLFFLVCFLACCWITPARADSGPKPSVKVDFFGLAGETYFATLLSETESTGPWTAGDAYQDSYGLREVWEAFTDYGAEQEDFYFLGFYEDCTESQSLSWTYYPPSRFRILLYFPEHEQFLVSSEVQERYAFDSYYAATVNPEAGTMVVERSYDWMEQILAFGCRVLLTLGIELVLALVFGFRSRRALRVVLSTNLITQILLNLLLHGIFYYHGAFAFVFYYVWLEVLVLVIEGLIYRVLLVRSWDRPRKPHPWLYATVANAASLGLGLQIANWIPGIF